jgi:hypothetical protein
MVCGVHHGLKKVPYGELYACIDEGLCAVNYAERERIRQGTAGDATPVAELLMREADP